MMSKESNSREVYRGWAPCTCHDGLEERDRRHAELVPKGVEVEDLIYELTMLSGGWVECAADQWWGVRLEGELYADNETLEGSVGWSTYIQGDALITALMESYNQWSQRYLEVMGRRWQPSWERSEDVQ